MAVPYESGRRAGLQQPMVAVDEWGREPVRAGQPRRSNDLGVRQQRGERSLTAATAAATPQRSSGTRSARAWKSATARATALTSSRLARPDSIIDASVRRSSNLRISTTWSSPRPSVRRVSSPRLFARPLVRPGGDSVRGAAPAAPPPRTSHGAAQGFHSRETETPPACAACRRARQQGTPS
jgi:hypothetical protein